MSSRTDTPKPDDARALAERNPERIVAIDYTNHRGERGVRRILPIVNIWGDNGYHTTPQWLLVAFDFKKNALREFAIADIHSWTPAHALDPTEEEAGIGRSIAAVLDPRVGD